MEQLDKKSIQLLQLYAEFVGGSGKLVFEDLEEAFLKRANPDLEKEMEEFPHPYRAYVEVGQRMVVQKIREAYNLGIKLKGNI